MKKKVFMSTLNYIVIIVLTTIYGFVDNLIIQSFIFNIFGTVFYIYQIINIKKGENKLKVNMLLKIFSVMNLYLLGGGIYIIFTGNTPSDEFGDLAAIVLLIIIVAIYYYSYFLNIKHK